MTAADVGSPEMDAMGGEELEEEVVVEERVTAAAEAKAYLASARPGFVPETYALRLHFFEPTGMTGYALAWTYYPEDLLLRDRDTHIFSGWTTRTRDIYGHGGSASSLKYFKELPWKVRELIEEAGFGPFMQLMTALTERWWDTTNTFHFRFGEMTVTPLDFAAITGLRVGGEPIPYDPSIDLDDMALEWFLGRVPRHSGGVAEYGQFKKYWDHEPASDVEVAQIARAYLLYLFGPSLFPNRRSRVHLSYLAGLVDLRQAGRYDWGGAALCTLYCFLGASSRGVGDTVGSYWRVVELWAYEVLGMFPPENTCTNPHLLPRGLAWGKEYRRAKERRGQVMTFRRWLDNITGVTFTVLDTDLEKYLRRTLDYAAYRDRYLATSLGVERELERRIAEAEARRAAGEAGGEVGDGIGARGRSGRSSRGRGWGARLPVGGRGASSSGPRRGQLTGATRMGREGYHADGGDAPTAKGLCEMEDPSD
ncbi:hypothetical protein RHMOL_Rhmol02G0189600 [Rhododendron molle]|uniref:Uncharacterized protein n=1 Tax=Rhododendron molle TaxID=49168 RepID=A0ACC0PT57_RHOML|nr:hypothetical protein RHMOL_Rhmol02G0189600 [Rhododendron molle]